VPGPGAALLLYEEWGVLHSDGGLRLDLTTLTLRLEDRVGQILHHGTWVLHSDCGLWLDLPTLTHPLQDRGHRLEDREGDLH